MELMLMELRKYKEVPKEQWNPSSSIPRLPWLLLSKYQDRFSESIEKVLVSLRPQSESDNNTNDNEIVIIVVMYSFRSVRLRFARPGFKKWATLQDGFDYERCSYFYDDSIYPGDRYSGDVVCYKGRVFAVCSNETFVVCEFDRPSPKAIAISPSPPLKYGDRAIEVYKFNGADNEGGGVWTKLEDLGGCTLFLSHSYSLSIPSTDQVDCRADCIYYTSFHCRFRISCNVNVFDMKDNTTEHYSFTNLSPVRVLPTFGLHCVMPSSS
ncbi:hypothetical protein LguiB_006498 [Lonicera macranthoides]